MNPNPGSTQEGQQTMEKISKLANDSQGNWTTLLQSLNQAVGTEGVPSYYSGVISQVEEDYNRLPESVKDGLKKAPPHVMTSFIQTCAWVALTGEQQGENLSQQISHFFATGIESSQRALARSGGSR